MATIRVGAVTGHIYRVERKRGPQWYMKFRLPDGRQVQRRVGPAWTSKRESPPPGYFTKRAAQVALDDALAQARRGQLGGVAQTRVTFAEAADEWLRYVEHDRERKRSTVTDYKLMVSKMKPVLGSMRLSDMTPETFEGYRDRLTAQGLANRTVNKYLVALHSIFQRAMKTERLPANPLRLVEKRPNQRRASIDVFSREEIMALTRAATSEQDAAIFQTAAFTGLRIGELLALRWRDLDFQLDAVHVRRSFTGGKEDTPKSGRERVVPMAEEVALALAGLSRRDAFADDDDLVFCGTQGGHVMPSALRLRYKAAIETAGLRELRFHDLRHTFGTHAIRTADSREVMEWMGHQDLKTTQIYLSFKPQADAARRISQAFASPSAGAEAERPSSRSARS